MKKSENSPNEIRITRLERRLRALQETFADRPREERSGHLVEEVQAALEDVSHEERTAFLCALKDRFPDFNGVAAFQTPAINDNGSEKAAPAPAAPAEMPTSNSMNAPTSSMVGAPSPLSIEALRQALHLKKGEPIDADRVYELAAMLVDTVDRLDSIATRVLTELSRSSGGAAGGSEFNPASGPLSTEVKTWVRGRADSIKKRVEVFRTRAGQLLMTIAACGNYAQEEVERIAPDRIERIVVAEGVGIFGSVPEKCWKRYKDLAADHANDGFKRRLNERIRQDIEKIRT